MTQTITLGQESIRYEDTGPRDAPTLVFVHGLLVDGSLWETVVADLGDTFRCVVPTLPLGSHLTPMTDRSRATPLGVADLIADFLDALELSDVTVVANDTGGALTQLLLTRRPERVGRVVLTNCDMFENFLPPAFRPLQWLAKARLLAPMLPVALGVPFLRDSRLGFGLLHATPLPAPLVESWTRPALSQRGVRGDAQFFTRHIDNDLTLDAAEKLRGFAKPVLFAWGMADKSFAITWAERLAALLADSRIVRIEGAGTFVSVDRPGPLAQAIRDFHG